jgi:predicted esterase
MKSRSWPRRSVPACGIISLLACGLAAAQGSAKAPAIALVDPADAPQWEALAKGAGWRVITPGPAENPDARALAVADAVRKAEAAGGIDPGRVYLAGRGGAAALVFYTVSRVPDLWAAAIAIEGSPQPAIDTGRIFSANFQHVPVLWVSNRPGDQALAARLKDAGINLEWRAADKSLTDAALLAWLGAQSREQFPDRIDCETNSPAFAGCYWIRMTKFDAGERNDVLPSTRIAAAAGAALDLGGFGFNTTDPGPGVLVSTLPQKYSGPLKVGDRIVELEGRPVENARQYVQTMAKYTEEKPIVATVQRGKDRMRVETRVILPRREQLVTARVQAEYLPAEKQVQIVSRTVTEMRITVPDAWAQDTQLFWNGLVLEKLEGPGCVLLSIDKELLHAARCP